MPASGQKHLVIDARSVRALPSGVGSAILRQLDGLERLLKIETGWKVSVIRYGPDLRYNSFRDVWTRFTSLHIIDSDTPATRHPHGDYWQQVTLPRLLERLGADVLYSPAFVGPLRLRRTAHLLMIHDDLVWSQPGSYPLRFRLYLRTLMRWTARRADMVIFPSRDARARVVRRLGLHAKKTAVVPHGIPADVFQPGPLEDRDPFALCVANAERRKNHEVLIRALKGMRGIKLLFVGFSPKAKSRVQELEDLGPRQRWEVVPPVTTAGLASLMRLASMLVLPSRAEGFGLPVLEAMASGTPLILSDLRVFREVAGDAALYLPPDDDAAWRRAMQETLSRGPEVRRRVELGIECARKHSVENTARRLLKAASDSIAEKARSQD